MKGYIIGVGFYSTAVLGVIPAILHLATSLGLMIWTAFFTSSTLVIYTMLNLRHKEYKPAVRIAAMLALTTVILILTMKRFYV